MGKVISFANFQNSSGKTTFIIETAKTLQRSGKTSILIDFDPKGDLSREFGISQRDSILQIISRQKDFHDVIQKTEFENTLLLPSSLKLAKTTNEDLKGINEIISYLNGKFDYIMIDTPPYSLPILSKTLEISERVISPVVFNKLTLYKTEKFLNFATNEKVKLVPNKYSDYDIPFFANMLKDHKELFIEKNSHFVKIDENFRGDWLTLIDF
ncbi:ATPase involved in chromosome partitioning [Thiovulum sp. ES]|nr:ATPase involved in chromosome partitioning [Thiovulum sp. ES]